MGESGGGLFFLLLSGSPYFPLKCIINSRHIGWTWAHKHAHTQTHTHLQISITSPANPPRPNVCLPALEFNIQLWDVGDIKCATKRYFLCLCWVDMMQFDVLCLFKSQWIPLLNEHASLKVSFHLLIYNSAEGKDYRWSVHVFLRGYLLRCKNTNNKKVPTFSISAAIRD